MLLEFGLVLIIFNPVLAGFEPASWPYIDFLANNILALI